MKGIWNNNVIAESDDTVLVEGNHFVPREFAQQRLFDPATHFRVTNYFRRS